jgi:haloacetate dehalogenase
MAEADMFEGFAGLDVRVNGVRLRGRVGGDPARPALVLLHGFPQSHLIWRAMAPSLARDFFVVAPDLRGYGDSERPPATADHSPYSKREMARDCVALLEHLGHRRFAVVGHDRGARVTARLAADHPDRVTRAMLLDIARTLDMYQRTTRDFATAYWHWFFLIQPAPLPEALIGAQPRVFVERLMGAGSAGLAPFPPEVLDRYVAAMTGPDRAFGMCEDYRAAATIDLDHDRADRAAGRRITAPLRVLWGERGVVGRLFDPLALWRGVATDVTGRSVDGGHYLPEELPDEIEREIRSFLR